MLYKLTNDTQYNPPVEEGGTAIHIFTTTNADGIEVPAFVDPDPEGESGYINNLLSVQYVVSEDNEILYEGPSTSNDKDIFVEIGYIDNIPVLYKTDPRISTETDYGDVFKYKGTMTIDDEIFDA